MNIKRLYQTLRDFNSVRNLVKSKNGFTLFELLIAIFIGTILIMSGAYAIRIGLFSMEREEGWFNDSTKERAAFDFFWQQVSSLRAQEIPQTQNKDILITTETKKAKKEKPVYFAGEKDFLSFVSPLSFKRHYGQGLIIAHYKVKSNDNGLWDLIYSEVRLNTNVLTKLSEEPANSFDANKENTIFLKDCDMISFAYLEGEKEEASAGKIVNEKVRDSTFIEGGDLKWKEKITKEIPLAIKLLVSKKGKEQELISPIMVTHSFLASGQ